MVVGRSRPNSNGKRSNKEEERRESTWRNTLFKKARELTVLTGCELALIINSANGIRHQVVENTSMPEIMEKFQRDFVVEDHIAPNEDNGVLLLEDNQAEAPMDMSLSDENVQALSHFHPQKNKPMKISKRDMHKILDSYTDQAIDMFEQKLNQNMINLLEKKVELMQKEMEVKWKEVYFSAAEKMQLLQEIENKQEEMNQLLAELQEFKKAQSECPSGERGNRSEETQFDILERSADVASTSGNQGVRDNTLEEIQFDILERTADVAYTSVSQERAKVEFHVERDDNGPDMDLELCLGFPCWKLQKR